MKTLKKNLPMILMILLGIALGVMLIIDAVRLTEVIFRIAGVGLIVLAVVMVIRYLIDRKDGEASLAPIFTAVVAFIIGLVLAIGAQMIVEAGSTLCAIFYGAVIIVNGVLKIAHYFSVKKQGAAVSAVVAVSGLISVALGVVMLIYCTQALKVLGIVLGISLIVQSVLDAIGLFMGHRMNKHNCIYDTSGDDSDYDLE